MAPPPSHPHCDLCTGGAWDTPCRAPLTFPETSALLTSLRPQRKAPRDRQHSSQALSVLLPQDDKKQFIISLHCKVIRNQWRFPSSLGFPLSDNSMGGFPLAPACPTRYLTSPHCLSPFQRAREASAMKCQRARQARGLLVFGRSCLQTICPMDGAGKVFYQRHSATAGTPGPGEQLSAFLPLLP